MRKCRSRLPYFSAIVPHTAQSRDPAHVLGNHHESSIALDVDSCSESYVTKLLSTLNDAEGDVRTPRAGPQDIYDTWSAE